MLIFHVEQQQKPLRKEMSFDFDVALKALVDRVEAIVKKSNDGNEVSCLVFYSQLYFAHDLIFEPLQQYLEWLAAFPNKAKQKLIAGNSSVFKMPKTPGRKKTRQQNKKRGLAEDEGTNHCSSLHQINIQEHL